MVPTGFAAVEDVSPPLGLAFVGQALQDGYGIRGSGRTRGFSWLRRLAARPGPLPARGIERCGRPGRGRTRAGRRVRARRVRIPPSHPAGGPPPVFTAEGPGDPTAGRDEEDRSGRRRDGSRRNDIRYDPALGRSASSPRGLRPLGSNPNHPTCPLLRNAIVRRSTDTAR
jgi:hypothetical protein